MNTSVRPAEERDIPWLLDQLRAFDRFFGAGRSLIPDTETAVATLQVMVSNPSGYPFAIAETNGERVGFIAGVLSPHFFNPDLMVLSELFWWVDPAHRGGRAGLLLLDSFLRWGRTFAHWIVFTLEAQSPVNPTTLERRGFRLAERNYLLEV